MGPSKCEKYSLKSEILDENSIFLIYIFTKLLLFVLFLTIPMARMYMLQCSEKSSNFHKKFTFSEKVLILKKFKFSEKVHIFRKSTN